MAAQLGEAPTETDGKAVLVDTRIGVTLVSLLFTVYTVLPPGVITRRLGPLPTGMLASTLCVETRVSVADIDGPTVGWFICLNAIYKTDKSSIAAQVIYLWREMSIEAQDLLIEN
jgi:hypothetical protein